MKLPRTRELEREVKNSGQALVPLPVFRARPIQETRIWFGAYPRNIEMHPSVARRTKRSFDSAYCSWLVSSWPAVCLRGRQHFAALKFGYETEKLRSKRDQLAENQRRLKLQREEAANPVRLEQLAKQLGMQTLQPAQIDPLRQGTNNSRTVQTLTVRSNEKPAKRAAEKNSKADRQAGGKIAAQANLSLCSAIPMVRDCAQSAQVNNLRYMSGDLNALRATAIDREGADPRRRAMFVALGLVAWMAIVGLRLVQLQITRHTELAARAKNQQLGTVETSPMRGLLLDRQGRELARSVDTESFYADPREIQNVNENRAKNLFGH